MYRTAAETAALLGVTVKALRVYEHQGLVRPVRTGAGYRTYGPDDIRRLHQVLALKSLGLSLAQIRQCLCGLGTELAPVLAAQERELRSRREALEIAIASVSAAKGRLAAGVPLSVDDLVKITREVAMATAKPASASMVEELLARHLSEEEHRRLGQECEEERRRRFAEEKRRLLAEATSLLGTDPGSPAALGLATRWRANAMALVDGDLELLSKLRGAFEEAMANPDMAKTIPYLAETAFLAEAAKRLTAGGRGASKLSAA
jgi:DNA-binding transcriptional MerR regulator